MKVLIKKIFSILLRVSISIVLLIFLFRNVDEKSMLSIMKHANKPLLAVAFLVMFFNYLLCLLRWQMLLETAQIHLPLKRVIISFCGGIFFNLFMPSTIGGDFLRSVDLARYSKKLKEVVASVLLDRLSGYVGLVILALSAVVLGWRFIRDPSVLLSVIILLGLLIVILLILFNSFIYLKVNKFLDSSKGGRIREAIRDLHQEMHIFREHKKMIFKNLFMSFLVQITAPISFYFIALALDQKISFIYFLVFLPIIGAITLLPISIGGLGLRDASTIFFFAKAGLSKDISFAMSLLSFFILIIYGALGGLIYVFGVRNRRIQSP